MDHSLQGFQSVWAVDFEYSTDENGLPLPFCMVALDLCSGREIRLWMDELSSLTHPPFPIGPRDIIVCYAATAEASAFLALAWPRPKTILDLYIEFKMLMNGRKRLDSYNLVNALTEFNLPHLDAVEKRDLQARCALGPPFTTEERLVLLDYCASDVYALRLLFPAMLPHLNLPQSFLRGRYMWNLAYVQKAGIPMDVEGFLHVQKAWEDIREAVIVEHDQAYQVFCNGQFSHDRWLSWCETQSIPWPRTPTNRASTQGKIWQEMAETFPEVKPMSDLHRTLNQMKKQELQVYPDGRHRPWLRPFGTLTGRNMPSPIEYIFGAPAWLRGYIQAPPGYAVVYLDWSGQEIGIVAAISGDQAMQEMYRTGDPHWAFGKHIGLIPEWVTKERVKETHGRERDICKILLFGVNYGMGAQRFSRQAKIPLLRAEMIIEQHRDTFRQFWVWIDSVIETAYLRRRIETPFGWTFYNVTRQRLSKEKSIGVNRRTLQDFPAQGCGADIMRLAVCWMVEAGLQVGGIVHDAIVLTAPLEHVNDHITQAQMYMKKAGMAVLHGFELFSEAKVYPHPERFLESRGQRTWDIVQKILGNTITHLPHEVGEGEKEGIGVGMG